MRRRGDPPILLDHKIDLLVRIFVYSMRAHERVNGELNDAFVLNLLDQSINIRCADNFFLVLFGNDQWPFDPGVEEKSFTKIMWIDAPMSTDSCNPPAQFVDRVFGIINPDRAGLMHDHSGNRVPGYQCHSLI